MSKWSRHDIFITEQYAITHRYLDVNLSNKLIKINKDTHCTGTLLYLT